MAVASITIKGGKQLPTKINLSFQEKTHKTFELLSDVNYINILILQSSAIYANLS